MALKVLYVASDGTQFDNEMDAKHYEDTLAAQQEGEGIYGWTTCGDEICYNDEQFIDMAAVIYIANEQALKCFRHRCEEEETGYMGIDEPGIYHWHVGKGIYENIEEVIDICQSKINLVSPWLKKAKKKGWRKNV